jgi:hypothetical protein
LQRRVAESVGHVEVLRVALIYAVATVSISAIVSAVNVAVEGALSLARQVQKHLQDLCFSIDIKTKHRTGLEVRWGSSPTWV